MVKNSNKTKKAKKKREKRRTREQKSGTEFWHFGTFFIPHPSAEKVVSFHVILPKKVRKEDDSFEPKDAKKTDCYLQEIEKVPPDPLSPPDE